MPTPQPESQTPYPPETPAESSASIYTASPPPPARKPMDTPTRTPAEKNTDYIRRRTERGLFGFQAIADFINRTIPEANLTRDHIYPLNRQKTGIILEAKTKRAKILLKNFRYWSITTPYQEIIDAGELHAYWDEDGPREVPDLDAPEDPTTQDMKEQEVDWKTDYMVRKRTTGLEGFQAIADFINSTVPEASITRDHVTPRNLKKCGIVLEALTERAQCLTKHYKDWRIDTPYQEILDSGELVAKWDMFGPRPAPVLTGWEKLVTETPQKVERDDEEEEDPYQRLSYYERQKLKKEKEKEKRRQWTEISAIRKRDRTAQQNAACALIASYIKEKLPGADITISDINAVGLAKKSIVLKARTDRAGYIGRIPRKEWPEPIFTNMRDILDAGELEVSWATEENEEAKKDVLNNGGVLRGLIHRKPGQGRFAGMDKEQERLEKRRIRKQAVDIYTQWLNSRLPEAQLSGEKVTANYLRSCGILVTFNSYRAQRIKYSPSTWQMTLCDILKDILEKGEVEVTWDEYGPRQCLACGEEPEKEGSSIEDLSDSELFTGELYTPKPPKLPKRQEFEMTVMQKLADYINAAIPDAEVEWQDTKRTILRTKYGIELDWTTKRAEVLIKNSPTKWRFDTPLDEILKNSEIVVIRKWDPVDSFIDEDTPLKSDGMSSAYRKRFKVHAQKLIAKFINKTLPGAKVVPEKVTPAKLLRNYGIYLTAKSDRARFFLNKSTSNWPQSTPIQEILDAGELEPDYDEQKVAQIEEKNQAGPSYRPKRKHEIRYPSITPRRKSKRVKYEESDQENVDASKAEAFSDDEEDDEQINKSHTQSPEYDSDDESFLQPHLLGKHKREDTQVNTHPNGNDSDSELSEPESPPGTPSNDYSEEDTPTQKGHKKQKTTTLKFIGSTKMVPIKNIPMQKMVIEQIKRVVANFINKTLNGANITHDKITPAALFGAGIEMSVKTARASVLLKEPQEWTFTEGSIHDILDAGEIEFRWINSPPKISAFEGGEYIQEFIRIAKIKNEAKKKWALDTLRMRLQAEGREEQYQSVITDILSDIS